MGGYAVKMLFGFAGEKVTATEALPLAWNSKRLTPAFHLK